MVELRPLPFAALVRRALAEHRASGALFDLPADKHHHGAADLDLSVRHHGRRASTPLGPAAGPHTQLAQGILLCWLGGARIIELRTVSSADPTEVARPCIAARGPVFHRESAQELDLATSAREYVKAALLLEVLRAAGVTSAPAAARPATLLEPSVGFDAASVCSEQLGRWLGWLTGAGAIIDELRAELTGELAPYADVEIDPVLCRSVTLRPARTCPAKGIERAARYLLQQAALDVSLELDPSWLGADRLAGLLHDTLGYRHIAPLALPPRGTAEAADLVGRLAEAAQAAGRSFAVRIGGSLQVEGDERVFAGAQTMSLAGRALYPLALSLTAIVREAVGPELQLGFAGGVDAQNVCDVVASDLRPVGVVSLLLRPGGYGRMSGLLDALERRMRELGAGDIGALVRRGAGISAAGGAADRPGERAAAAHRNLLAALDRALGEARYRQPANAASPRKIGSRLQLFDCISCDKCVPTCPNDAMFVYYTDAVSSLCERAEVASDGSVAVAPDDAFMVERRHQLACYAELCNDCGHCELLCPEDGGPQLQKPRFFVSPESLAARGAAQGFCVEERQAELVVHAIIEGRALELRLDHAAGVGRLSDGQLCLELGLPGLQVLRAAVVAGAGAAPGHVLSTRLARAVLAVCRGVLDSARPNAVNTLR